MIEQEIAVIRNKFQNINRRLTKISEGGDNSQISKIESEMLFLEKEKKRLTDKYGSENLKKYNLEFDPVIKQILEKLDNIVEKYTSERDTTAANLKNYYNKKKLLNYSR